jgi:APA family basic amino acid/polyamine antiporter
MSAPAAPERAFVRALGLRDVALLTIGATLGSGIFLTSSDVARATGSAALSVLVWPLGGLLVLCGALSFAELAAMFPRAGGQYHFIREAWGRLPAFLFGWAAFLVIMSGGNATLAAGFGEYLTAFVPALADDWLELGGFSLRGTAVAGVVAIVVLSEVNARGVRLGAAVQNAVTLAKLVAIAALALAGLVVAFPAPAAGAAPVAREGGLLAGLGVAMIGVLWTYDGWYGATNVGEEVRDAERNLPRGLILGTIAVAGLYALVNLAYVRALTPAEMAASPRVAEAAALRLLGPWGGLLVSGMVVVSCLGCLSATVLYAARVYVPMARDGLFFRSLGTLDATTGAPVVSLRAQAAWSALLTCSGTYEQLYTYVTFVVVASYVAIGGAVFVLRRTRPDAPRPYRTWGYPLVPAVFVAASLGLLANTLVERPREALVGSGLLALGLPAFAYWRREASR